MASRELTSSLQDYLEAILELSSAHEAVRITDIAAKLGIAKASATQAIKNLSKRGLVIHQYYGPISLTPRGREEAQKVLDCHQVLLGFLVNVLEVEPLTAAKDACLMEHAISPQTLQRLVEYMSKSPNLEETNLSDRVSDAENCRKEVNAMPVSTAVRLSELPIGGMGTVQRVEAKGQIKKRILEMGVTNGTQIQVRGVAPMGDPIDVMVKGYHLSLRKNEAAMIIVESDS
jgi:DtxR family Mn-dependent transcriptional regulator